MEIQIDQLTKFYNENKVLDIPALTVHPGEVIGLVGNNGAGKTTLMRLMLDLTRATTGRILLDGDDVSQTERWKQTTGSFIDGRFLIDFYTPEEYFAFIASVYGFGDDELAQRLKRYEPLLRDDVLGTKKYLRSFSEGNRQKIGIIGAMIVNPDLLVLDEPFNYLDPSSQLTVTKMIHDMNAEMGTTIVISSHNLNYIADDATRILLLEKGLVVKDIPNVEGSALTEMNKYFENQQ